MEKKIKGGAEKLREKKKKELLRQAQKCSKLADIFAAGTGNPSTSSSSDLEHHQFEIEPQNITTEGSQIQSECSKAIEEISVS